MNNLLLDRLAKQSLENRLPFQGTLELTRRCNFQCKMCYLNHGADYVEKSFLPASFYLEQARYAKEIGLLVLVISGGEAFIYPELDELMEGLCKMGFLLSFNTNGSMIVNKGIEWFVKYPVTKINISLYGASDETYIRLCHSPKGTFERVIQGIDLLIENKQNVYLTTVITPQNQDDLPAMIKIAEDRGLQLHIASYTYPSCNQECYRLDPKEAANMAYEYVFKKDIQRINQAILESKIKQANPELCQFAVCNGARNSFAISFDGKLMPCVMLRESNCNLQEYTFEQAWRIIQKKKEAIQVPDKCQKCELTGNLCPACKGSLSKENSINGNIDYLCNIANETRRIAEREIDKENNELSDSGHSSLYSCSI